MWQGKGSLFGVLTAMKMMSGRTYTEEFMHDHGILRYTAYDHAQLITHSPVLLLCNERQTHANSKLATRPTSMCRSDLVTPSRTSLSR